MHAYTLYSSVRPFGITAMLGCWTQEKVRIFIHLDTETLIVIIIMSGC